MKKHWLFVVVVAMFMQLSTANAAWFIGTINRIQFGVTSNLIVYVDAPSNHECGSLALQFVDPNSPSLKYIYASMLAWEAQQKRVQFAITSCSGNIGVFSYVEDLKQ